MKLKQRTSDFRVEEVNRIEPGNDGPFTIYRLSKSGIGTPEAIAVVAKAWRLDPRRIGYAGLKDKWGQTGQLVSIRNGRRENFPGATFKLNYLGHAARPVGRGTIEANRFVILIRDLKPRQAELVVERARAAGADGFLDYYDDQRFGSLRGTRGRFIARALLDGDPQEALRLSIACPARPDRSRTKRRRKLLKEHWGKWEDLAGTLDRSVERRICETLAAGSSYEDAYALLPLALRSIHLAAYQAHLFNACLRRLAPPGPRHHGVDGPYVFYKGDPGALRDMRLPLMAADAPAGDPLDAVLLTEHVTRAQCEPFPFRGGSRGVVVVPQNLEVEGPGDDELNRKRHTVALAFSLRAGSYGTMLVKRCTYGF